MSTRIPPLVTPDTEPFLTGGAAGELLICRCGSCGKYSHPPSPICPRCHSLEVEPTPVSGRATVIGFTINEQRWTPDLEVPYVVALVALDDQPDIRLMTNIINCPVDSVYIDMAVKVVFEQCEDVWLPLFEPADAR